MIIVLLFFVCDHAALHAQVQELEQLSLDIEKLTQFKQILSDMKAGYEILTKGYGAIRDLSEGNFNLHQAFLDGLLAVSPTVKNYARIAEIVQMELDLVSAYKNAFGQFQASGQFREDELSYISGVYSRLVDKSLKNIEDLTAVITAGTMRMSDAERLREIDRIYADMEDQAAFLRSFNNNTKILALQRAKETGSLQVLQQLFAR
jgi:hypothetical protein